MTGYSKFAGMFLAATLMTGAANAAPRLSPDLQNQAVAIRLVSCLAKAARRHDDGVSTPGQIAARIAPLCQSDFTREETAFATGMKPADQLEYRAMMEEDRTTLAAEVVSHERAAQNRLAQSD